MDWSGERLEADRQTHQQAITVVQGEVMVTCTRVVSVSEKERGHVRNMAKVNQHILTADCIWGRGGRVRNSKGFLSFELEGLGGWCCTLVLLCLSFIFEEDHAIREMMT